MKIDKNELYCVRVPTQEISNEVQKKLFELGYIWRVYDRNKTLFLTNGGYKLETVIFVYPDKKWLKYGEIQDIERYEKYIELSIYDLFQIQPEPIVEVSIKVNGKEVNEPLSIDTAKRLGIVK